MLHHTRLLMLAVSALSTTVVSFSAYAADSSTLGPIAAKPAFHSAGLRVPITGDDNGNGSIAVAYRATGGPQLPGHSMLRLPGGRASSTLFHLSPDTEYEVTLTLTDPDNAGPVSATATFRTRTDVPAAATGGALYVDALTGDDSNTGSKDSPFKTIQRAADAASAGATIRVAAGVYREMVTVKSGHGGTQNAPVWMVAEPGAVVDGSDPALEDGTVFQDDGGGIWSAPFQGPSTYVAVDDVRLYDYPTLSALQKGTAGISGGFFVDKAAGRIRLKLPSGDSPASHKVHVARFPTAFTLDSVTDVVLEGFEVRYFGTVQYSGTGVALRNTSRAWIRKNDIHHMNEGVRIHQGGSDNVVELNTIRDTSIWSWPWDAVKNHTPEATAITVSGAEGTVVRRNTSKGNFNGIYVGSFDDSSEAIGADTDVYENELSEHGDDGFEPEGACVNVRFWSNAVHGMHNGVSLSPIEVGPLWVVRNLLEGYGAHALKVNNGPTGWMLVYHNTSVPSEISSQAMAPSVAFARLVTRNNIWAAHRYVFESNVGLSGPVDLDYDNLFTDSLDGTPRFLKWNNVRYDTMAQLKASHTIETNGWSIPPKYENAPAGDYRLAEGSALIDVGAVIPGINDQGFAGAGPDVGAFERGALTPDNDAGAPGGSGGSTGGSGNAGTGGDGVGGAPGSGGSSANDAGATGGTSGSTGNGPSGNGGSSGTPGEGGAPGTGGAAGGPFGGNDPSPAVIDEAAETSNEGGCATSPLGNGSWSMIALASLLVVRRRRSGH